MGISPVAGVRSPTSVIAFLCTTLSYGPIMNETPRRLVFERPTELPVERLRVQPAAGRRTGCPFHDVRQMLREVGLRPTRQRLALGWLLFAKGDREGARGAFEAALVADPDNLDALYQLALLARDEGQGVLALDYARRALTVDPQDPELLAASGGDYLKLQTVLVQETNHENHRLALEWWNRWCARPPENNPCAD